MEKDNGKMNSKEKQEEDGKIRHPLYYYQDGVSHERINSICPVSVLLYQEIKYIPYKVN